MSTNDSGKKPAKSAGDGSSKRAPAKSKQLLGEATGKWIANLNAEPPATKQVLQGNPLNMSSIVCIEKFFDDFQRYAKELGKREGDENVKVICHRPAAPNLATKPQLSDSLVIFQGSVITGQWALVMQAEVNKISCFIVPFEYLTAFPGRKAFFQTFMEMDAADDKGKTVWIVDGQIVLDSMMSYIAKKLFGSLIRVSRGAELRAEFDSKLSEGSSIGISNVPYGSEYFSLDSLNTLPDEIAQEAADLPARLEQSKHTLLMAFEGFMNTIDHEVDRLGAIGLKGLQMNDLESTRKSIKRGTELKTQREKLQAIREAVKISVSQ